MSRVAELETLRGRGWFIQFYDPDGARYGIPTYPWRMAPAGLATRRQLTAAGLRPGGQPVVAQVMWRRRRRVQVAYLYAVSSAKPKREASPAQVAALSRALAARRRCPQCGLDRGYVLPARLGVCLDCVLSWRGWRDAALRSPYPP